MRRISILLLEDSPLDEELIRARLVKDGMNFVMDRVDTGSTFEHALIEPKIDVILADHSLPGYDGVAALALAREQRPEIPFLFVSATLGEEIAIECLKRGATDYVLKQRLERLGPAIRRALDEARERAERVAAQNALAARSVQLQRLAEVSTRLNAALDVEAVLRLLTEEARELLDANEAITSLTGEPNRVPIVPKSATACHPRAVQRRRPLDDSLVQSLITRTNRAVRMSRDELLQHSVDSNLEPAMTDGLPVHGCLAAALTGRNGRKLGVIQLLDKNESGFTADDEYVLVQLAQMAAGAIENARLYEELRANDRRKDEFLAMLAHELRNPLAAVNNALRVLRISRDDEGRNWASEVVERQFRQLARLIDDLLDVSRISSGKIRLQRELVAVEPVVMSAVESVRPLMTQKRHEFIVESDGQVHYLVADPVRLEQVLVNLLTNAAKYTEPGGRVCLRVEREGAELSFRIRDTGIGIPSEQVAQMFDLFAQGERSIARSEGGLGIGLTIARKLVEMHQGRIEAASDGLGTGSEFTVRLPAIDPPPGAAPRSRTQATTTYRSSRILVVDDNVDTARSLSRLLELLGHEIRTAHDGAQALQEFYEFTPEFILMDIGLPGMDGYEVVRQLRSDPRSDDTVIIAISGYGQREDRRRSREAGFDHHLVKPVDHEMLSSLLAQSAQNASNNPSSPRQGTQPTRGDSAADRD
ncbi:MAG: response regulator [Isosphaeraceae bacterium]